MSVKAECSLDNPLIVDIDGTLIKTNLHFEAVSGFVVMHPFRILYLLVWLLKGKLTLKSNLTCFCQLDSNSLSYNNELLGWLEEQSNHGRKIVLATASYKLFANQIVSHLLYKYLR